MRLRLFVPLLFAAVALVPAGALAQSTGAAPDPTSMNGPASGGPASAVDACGNTQAQAVGAAPGTPAAAQGGGTNAKDDTAANQQQNLSSVTGTIVHVEGNLMLLSITAAPATGNDRPAGTQTSASNLAVVQLPAGCASPSLSDGTTVKVDGLPTVAGILDAQTILVE